MRSIEIPLQSEKTRRYRFFEILPGALSWSILLLPLALSFVNASITAVLIIAFFLIWFVRAVGLNVRVLQGWKTMNKQQNYDWRRMFDELKTLEASPASRMIPKWHAETVERIKNNPTPVKADDVVHAVIIAAYNESYDVIGPTVEYVASNNFDMKKIILVMAYEGRDGAQAEPAVKRVAKEYKNTFKDLLIYKHPLTPGEVRGKGGNITYAARKLQKYLEDKKINPANVVVTTLDSDNRPHPSYFAALAYTFAVTPEPLYASYQPIPMFTNNIWDVPAPMRVIATGNSFWNMILSLRPHILRNFSSHAQPMNALIKTDFWSVRTIVEDGHQFWRSYFRFDGKHEVYPLYLPIYQDAVLSSSYRKTLKAQFYQIRRWAYGASDVSYVAEKAFFTPNKIDKTDRLFKFLRLLEGHVSWATAPLILAFAAFIPVFVNNDSFTANQLPIIASRIQTVALIGIFITFFLSMRLLPPKPARYKRRRTFWMVVQWVLLPVTTICYNALAAVNSQTRLMFKKYLDNFDVTDKNVKK